MLTAAFFLSSGCYAADPALTGRFLEAARAGECIDHVTFRMISEQGPGKAAEIVSAALSALRQTQPRQRELGCRGDIGAQAIAAGADPAVVLQATAAGL